ncbi:MAG: zeta toxin family protein [Alphaproteobacteria bacterium]|nr:zeta toxin family protein [Alphaproteobacteria bacterium]MDD9920336.1 zeta toxin family protein [Alphaproteobacteria bacterium]
MIIKRIVDHWTEQCPKDSLAQAQPNYLEIATAIKAMPTSNAPTFIHMMGVPGSGKTTIAEALYAELTSTESWMWHGFDGVMQKLRPYQEDLTTNTEEAFNKWELPARICGYKLLEEAVAKNVNILFDHGGADSNHPELLSWVKKQGYTVFMVKADIPQKLAEERVQARSAQPNTRFTPIKYVGERCRVLKDLEPKYAEIVDKLYKVDNSGSPENLSEVQKILAEIEKSKC